MNDLNNGTIASSTQQQVERLCQWLASPEGQQRLADGLKQAREMNARFQHAQRIDPQILRQPVTI